MQKAVIAKTPPKEAWYLRAAKELKRNAGLYVLVIIPVLFLIVFSYAPMYGVQIAFKDYRPSRGIWESEWVGLHYFKQFLETPNFWEILWNTVYLNLYGLLTFPLGIIFALLINYLPLKKFVKTVQLVSYAPNFISTVVMVSMILQFFDARTGLFNAITGLFGAEPVNYMGRPEAFAHIYTWTGVWQGLGYGSIIYISALSDVSPELHEVAIVDGATIMKRIWHIDLPALLPTISILLILRCGSMLSTGFEKILLMQNPMNLSVSEVIDTYVYKQSLAAALPQYSYSSAVGLFLSVINLFILILVNYITGRISKNSLF